jgi:hypothetical protein
VLCDSMLVVGSTVVINPALWLLVRHCMHHHTWDNLRSQMGPQRKSWPVRHRRDLP